MNAEIEELLKFEPAHRAWPSYADTIVQGFGEAGALAYLRDRKRLIEDAARDPLKHGYTPEIWRRVDREIEDLRSKTPQGVVKIIIWGGHRSSKTRKASNYVLKDLLKPGRHWWCCDSTEGQSRLNQMRLLWEQMPQEWKNLERDAITDMRYSLSDGFPKNRFVTPYKSEATFKFYSMDVANLPGPEIDGAWCDELVPLSWVELLTFRLTNRNGLLLITFTPELGWNETIQYFYEGAQEIEKQEAPLLPRYNEDGEQIGYQKLPRVMQCKDPSARIIYFWTQDNPFGNYEALVHELKSKSAGEDEIKIRAYGVCTKSYARAFTMFDRSKHVITQAQFRSIITEYPKAMRVQMVDPCDGRNWFMIWIVIPRLDKWIIYREWPSYGHPKAYVQGFGMPGPWAVSGAAADGVRGPAQDNMGFSLEAYRDEILRVEEGETIDARYIDSRYATQRRTDIERITTLQEQMMEVGMDFLCMTPGRGSILKTESSTPDGSIIMINSALFYDIDTELGKFSPKLGRLNEPQLQIVDTCPNTIDALENWTGIDGQKGARKDPIDCVRGLFLSAVNYVDDGMFTWKGGGVSR